MTTQASTLPSLFGRATVVHGEHADLRGAIERLLGVCRALEADASPTDSSLLTLVEDFSERLRLHFESEESPAYFGALVTESPRLTGSVRELELEHDLMRGAIEALLSLARAERAKHLVTARLSDVIATLLAHEHKERALIQEFFGIG